VLPGKIVSKIPAHRTVYARRHDNAQILLTGVAAIGIAAVGWIAPASLQAQQAVAIDNDDIGGVVTGPKGRRPASG